MLNWHPGNIFRTVPSQNPYKLAGISSETPKNALRKEKTEKKTYLVFATRCFVQNGFLKSRPHMAALADPQSGKCSYIDHLSFIFSSKTGLWGPKHSLLPKVFDLNPSLP